MVLMWREYNGDLTVAEVCYASWVGNDSNCSYKDKDGNIVKGTGLYFDTFEGGSYIIPGYSQAECEDIVRRLYLNGKYDLSQAADYSGGQAYQAEG